MPAPPAQTFRSFSFRRQRTRSAPIAVEHDAIEFRASLAKNANSYAPGAPGHRAPSAPRRRRNCRSRRYAAAASRQMPSEPNPGVNFARPIPRKARACQSPPAIRNLSDPATGKFSDACPALRIGTCN